MCVAISMSKYQNSYFSDAYKMYKMYALEHASVQGDKMTDKNGFISKGNLDPKLIQVAQLFVQDLINRARMEVERKNPEQQVLKSISQESDVRKAVLQDTAQFLAP